VIVVPFQNVPEEAFEPEVIEIMVAAYDGVCKAVNLSNVDNAFTRLVAKMVLRLAQRGERDPDRICQQVLKRA
jgi:hypothetical protein